MEFKRLAKWKNALNSCIRCGYCYEHCPVFKSTKWEIDSPRGKLILLYGLLSGELEPSDYIANKIFECFHCGRCQKACASGVPTLEVFDAARADLIDAGFNVVGTTSQTNHDICARCLNCVRMCKHEARSFVDGKIITDRLKCRSCGSCLDICSEKGITIGTGYGTNPDELSSKIKKFLNNPENPDAKAIVFMCGWSSYPGFQASVYDKFEISREYEILVTACSGRLKSQTVLESFEEGAWGVLICCCPENECDHGGSARVKARMKYLTDFFEKMDIEKNRIQIAEIPQGNPKLFTDTATKFIKEIGSLGPAFERVGKC
ncbi:MAG: hydrogenase iron-sulfur subunit [Syntrophorhabdaceae bacterium]|nr:hydrogenase iron-sulfur subunit [Syntrophorhabdaceae bacterium]